MLSKLVGKRDKNEAATEAGEIDGDDEEGVTDAADEFDEDESDVYDELNHRVGEIEQSVDRTSSAVRALQSEQQTLGESMRDLTDTNRRLLGVYDQLVGSANPFRDEEASRFGVLTGGTGHTAMAVDEPDDSEGAALSEFEPAGTVADGRRSFADLVAEQEASAEPDGGDEGEFGEAEDEAEAVHAVGGGSSDDAVAASVAAAENGWQPEDRMRGTATSLTVPAYTDASTVQLAWLPRGYAADVLALEWLSDLVTTAGAGGALKALSYYERIGWLGPEARRDLERFLAGALDEGADRELTDLSAVVHDRSFRYIARLRALDRMSSVLAGV